MPSFTTHDGTQLSCRVLGERPGADPVVCLPGGPLRASSYFGDLGGLAAHRELVFLELPQRRVDELVPDVEALRVHLGRERLDLLAHSAGGNLALLYAAAHPDRIGRLALVTPGTHVVGIDITADEWQAALQRRAGESWYDAAIAGVRAWDAGDESAENELAVAPLFYGRWDAAAQAHAAGQATEMPPDAERIYYGDGAFDPPATRAALQKVDAPVLVLAGELDPQPSVRVANELAELFPRAEVAIQPGAGHFPWLDDPAAFVHILQGFFTP